MAYEHIDALVQRFREGDSEAARQLLEMFQPIIQRAFRFLRYGHVAGDEIFVGLCRVYGDGNVAEGARVISDRLAVYDDDEILAEVHYCFFTAAHSSSNLQYGFRRNIARRVGFLLARKRRDVIYLDDVPVEHPATDSESEMSRWVLGITASEPFDRLSCQERELLYRRIVMEESFGLIAERFGKTEHQIIDQFHRLVRRLRERDCNTSEGKH